MPETFKCPSCSAPLDFQGTTFQKCEFCGSSIVVPSDVFYKTGTQSFHNLDLSSLSGKAKKIGEIRRALENGNKIEAIKIFRKTFGTELKEAKIAVEAMDRGDGYDVSAITIDTSNPAFQKGVTNVFRRLIIGGAIVAALLALIPIGIIGMLAFLSGLSGEGEIDVPNPIRSSFKSAASETAKFGGEGIGAGKFHDNRAVAVDGDGRVYSVNYGGGRLQIFDSNGKFLDDWKILKDGYVKALAADRKGNLYIANAKGIFAYEGKSGNLLHEFSSSRVNGLAVNADGDMVASIGKGIVIFNSRLKKIKEINDAAEQANSTFGFGQIAVNGAGNIYALDRNKNDICKFSPEGKFLNRITVGISSNDIAISSRGHIYLSNVSEIHILDKNGSEISSFDTKQAFGMAFDKNGDLFVASRPYIIKYKINLEDK